MTTPNTPTPSPGLLTRPVLVAGLLGGLLGGVFSFGATRLIKPAEAAKPEPPRSEARAIADSYVAKLKDARFDDFAIDAKQGWTAAFATEAEFNAFKTKLAESRLLLSKNFGPSSGEFELLRETALSPSLVRLVYLEKFERGGVYWVFVLYHGKDSWKLSWVDFGANLSLLFAGLS